MKQISLANLKESSAQEVFDFVAHHMLTQNEKCGNPEFQLHDGTTKFLCRYQHNGLKCAAGCLIADNEYHPKFEGCGWGVHAAKGNVDWKHSTLIRHLQEIHDNRDPSDWKADLDWRAEKSKLLPYPRPVTS